MVTPITIVNKRNIYIVFSLILLLLISFVLVKWYKRYLAEKWVDRLIKLMIAQNKITLSDLDDPILMMEVRSKVVNEFEKFPLSYIMKANRMSDQDFNKIDLNKLK
jgi:hypothetical protein